MLTVTMRRASITRDQVPAIGAFLATDRDRYSPLVKRTIGFQASELGVPGDALRGAAARSSGISRQTLWAEVLCTRQGLVVVQAMAPLNPARVFLAPSGEKPASDAPVALELYGVGDAAVVEPLNELVSLLSRRFELNFEIFRYTSSRFAELKQEGMVAPDEPSPDDLRGAALLADRDVRTAAVAVASAGGLLVGDFPQQLPEEARDRATEIREGLQVQGLVGVELVVICSRSSRQVARVPSRQALEAMAADGLRCACGRDVRAERVEEALTVTDRCRHLLNGSKWLSLLLMAELMDLGIKPEHMLIEQKTGNDEVDCFADVNGQLAFFELKDKEFNLGEAYSAGAKISIARPDHAVIVTSAYVGNDAKEHFRRAESSEASDSFSDREARSKFRYVEGVSQLRSSLAALVHEVNTQRAVHVLGRVLPMASLTAESLVAALDSPRAASSDAGPNGDTLAAHAL